MKKKIISMILVVAFMLPITAQAGFLSNLIADFGYRISISANETLKLYDALSKDMNAMADRIMDMATNIDAMADKILEMADKIGEMADKIVHTEQMMSDLTLNMATLASDVGQIKENTVTGEATGMYIDYAGQTDLHNAECPEFTMSNSPSEYVVYVSNSLTMNTNTISVLVRNHAELEALWPSLVTLGANGKIYIGVKSVVDNKISSLSNILGYNLL